MKKEKKKKVCRKKIKVQPMIIIFTDLVELEPSMLYTKIQPQSPFDAEEGDFKEVSFLPYMDILFSCAESFEQIGNTLSTESPCEIWLKLLKQFQRRRRLKQFTILYTYIAQWQGQMTLKGQKFDYN